MYFPQNKNQKLEKDVPSRSKFTCVHTAESRKWFILYIFKFYIAIQD